MTTQVLISEQEILSESLDKSRQAGKSLQADKSRQAASVNGSAPQAHLAPLPYQANHQVELLHLQAETEVLLQHLRTLKQRKLSAAL
jgi:hypothetical protein